MKSPVKVGRIYHYKGQLVLVTEVNTYVKMYQAYGSFIFSKMITLTAKEAEVSLQPARPKKELADAIRRAYKLVSKQEEARKKKEELDIKIREMRREQEQILKDGALSLTMEQAPEQVMNEVGGNNSEMSGNRLTIYVPFLASAKYQAANYVGVEEEYDGSLFIADQGRIDQKAGTPARSSFVQNMKEAVQGKASIEVKANEYTIADKGTLIGMHVIVVTWKKHTTVGQALPGLRAIRRLREEEEQHYAVF